jgi:hypothetical protein
MPCSLVDYKYVGGTYRYKDVRRYRVPLNKRYKTRWNILKGLQPPKEGTYHHTKFVLNSVDTYKGHRQTHIYYIYKMERLCRFFVQFHAVTSKSNNESIVIPVTGRGGLYGCEMLRMPRCLDNLLTDGGKVVSPTHRPHSTPQKHYFSASGTHYC